jgi:capsular polysaccharide biosynthesis protein
MNFLTFIQILGRSWWIIGLTLVVGLGSTAYFTHRQTPIYQATTTVVIGPSEKLAKIGEIVDSLNTLDRRSVVATYAKIPTSRTVRDRAREQLGLSHSQMRLYQVRTSVVPDTNILQIAIEGPDPRLAAEVANAVAEQAKSYVQEFYGIFGLKVLDRASQPSRPVGPELTRNLSVGAVLGLLLGIGLAFLIEYGRRWKHPSAEQPAPESEAELFA